MLDLHPFLLYCGERKKEDKKGRCRAMKASRTPAGRNTGKSTRWHYKIFWYADSKKIKLSAT